MFRLSSSRARPFMISETQYRYAYEKKIAMMRSLVTLVLLFLSTFSVAFQQSPAHVPGIFARGAQSIVRVQVGTNDYLSTVGQAQESFPSNEPVSVRTKYNTR